MILGGVFLLLLLVLVRHLCFWYGGGWLVVIVGALQKILWLDHMVRSLLGMFFFG